MMSKVRNELLKQEREKRGWSQARVAEQIDTDAANISRWERGYATPSPYFREKLCQIFDKTAQDLGFVQNGQRKGEQLSEGIQRPPSPITSPLEAVLLQEVVEPQQHDRKILASGRLIRFLAVLSYSCGWVSGLFLLLLNKDRFTRFHSLQSILFFGASNTFSLIIIMLLALLKEMPRHDPHNPAGIIGITLAFFFALINLFTFVVWIVGMFQAWQGHYYQIPFVGRLSEGIVTQLRRKTPLFSGESFL